MSVAGILNSLISNYQPSSSIQTARPQIQLLGQDLSNGDLAAAQSDFATLEQAFSESAASTSTSTSSASNAITQAFQQLATDLKSGNLSAARNDYASIQQDLQHLHQHKTANPSHHGLATGTPNTVPPAYTMPPVFRDPVSFIA